VLPPNLTTMSDHFENLSNQNKETHFKMEFTEQNSLEIYLDSLLHTRKKTFDGIKLIPLKRGNSEIIIKIICEEYRENREFKLPISVL